MERISSLSSYTRLFCSLIWFFLFLSLNFFVRFALFLPSFCTELTEKVKSKSYLDLFFSGRTSTALFPKFSVHRPFFLHILDFIRCLNHDRNSLTLQFNIFFSVITFSTPTSPPLLIFKVLLVFRYFFSIFQYHRIRRFFTCQKCISITLVTTS